MLKKIYVFLISVFMTSFCQAGTAFDNFQCLNCVGEIRVPIGYVIIGGDGFGHGMYLVVTIFLLVLAFLEWKRKNKSFLIMLGASAMFCVLGVGTNLLENHFDLEAKKEIVGNYNIEHESLNIYLENDEVYESKTKEKFTLGPYRDYLKTSKYHILRKEDKIYLVNFDKKTVYLLEESKH